MVCRCHMGQNGITELPRNRIVVVHGLRLPLKAGMVRYGDRVELFRKLLRSSGRLLSTDEDVRLQNTSDSFPAVGIVSHPRFIDGRTRCTYWHFG